MHAGVGAVVGPLELGPEHAARSRSVAAPSVKLLVSPDMQYESGTAEYLALDVAVPVLQYFTVTPHVGYQWIDNNARYGTAGHAEQD